jgi:nicotinate-nucleotide adenylyltransferase
MRVALFGGTFDPPHRGHVALARLARERLSLDRILVAPVATQPLKQQTSPASVPASFKDRVAMVRLAFAREPKTEISLIDAPRPKGKSNYTIDTIHALRRQLNPDDTLFCILGADSFLTIGKWCRSTELLTACDFIIGARPGFDIHNVQAALPAGISSRPSPTSLPNVRTFELSADTPTSVPPQPSRLYLLTDLAEDVSATQVRAALRGETGAAQVLDPAVEQYIRAHHLYPHL